MKFLVPYLLFIPTIAFSAPFVCPSVEEISRMQITNMAVINGYALAWGDISEDSDIAVLVNYDLNKDSVGTIISRAQEVLSDVSHLHAPVKRKIDRSFASYECLYAGSWVPEIPGGAGVKNSVVYTYYGFSENEK